jgi:hypothetical protein
MSELGCRSSFGDWRKPFSARSGLQSRRVLITGMFEPEDSFQWLIKIKVPAIIPVAVIAK